MIYCIQKTVIILALIVVSLASKHFLGRHMSEPAWNEMLSTLQCWNEKGSWRLSNTTSYKLLKYFEDFHTKENFHAASSTCYQYYARYRQSPLTIEPTWSLPSNDVCMYPYEDLWDKEKICTVLRGQTLLIVGDSLQVHFYQTMLLMVTGDTALNVIHCSGHDIVIHFLRNDFLSIDGVTTLNKTAYNGGSIAVNYDWAPSISKWNITILLINRGAHYVDDYTLHTRIDEVLNHITTTYPNVTVIYRNTPVGHPFCCTNQHTNWFDSFHVYPNDSLITIVQNALTIEPFVGYHWYEFTRQNNMTEKLIHDKYPSVIYLDFDAMTKTRSDHHSCRWGDCLHYCFHSVTDWWVIHFYNLIHLGRHLTKIRAVEIDH